MTKLIRYVGQTLYPKERMKWHFYCRNEPRHARHHTSCWFRKLWREHHIKPELEVIEEVDMEYINEREIFWIQHYLSAGCKLTNCTLNPQVRARGRSSLHRANQINVYHDGEHLQFVSQNKAAAFIGTHYKNLSGMLRRHDPAFWRGMVISRKELGIEEISAAIKGGKFRYLPRKPVKAIHRKTGEIETFDGIQIAADALGINIKNISQALRRQRPSYHHRMWLYA